MYFFYIEMRDIRKRCRFAAPKFPVSTLCSRVLSSSVRRSVSYKATRLPRKVPVLVLVCPSDANLVYFALELEERLFSVNVPERRVVEFIEDSYELVTPWPAAPSCRYVLPWFLPLKIAQGKLYLHITKICLIR